MGRDAAVRHGEHGVVDLHAHAMTHKLRWTFDLHSKHALDATVRDRQGTVVAHLGAMFSAEGCASTLHAGTEHR